MPLPDRCQGLVYDPGDGNLALRDIPLRPPRAGEVVVKVSLSSICRSDLHTINGTRSPAGPLILGHEICGAIAAMGQDISADEQGAPEHVRVIGHGNEPAGSGNENTSVDSGSR